MESLHSHLEAPLPPNDDDLQLCREIIVVRPSDFERLTRIEQLQIFAGVMPDSVPWSYSLPTTSSPKRPRSEEEGPNDEAVSPRPDPALVKIEVEQHADQSLLRAFGPYFIKSIACSAADCSASFSTVKLLRSHRKLVHNMEPYQCPVEGCGMQFEKFVIFGPHVRSAHRDIHSWNCTICQATFSKCSDLNTHKNFAHEKGEFICGQVTCFNFIASTRLEVSQHNRIRHAKALKKE